MNIRRTSVALVIAACLAPATASAQVSDADRATARTLGHEGHEAIDRKDWAGAADRFTRADALVHAPTFVLGLAQAQVGLGKLVSAQETYSRILREGLPPSPPPAFTKALETARKELEALAPRIPYVTIQVRGPAAAAARVTLDGAEVPSAALGAKRPVDPGRHVIRVEVPGVAPLEAAVMSVEGKPETVVLEPPAPRAAPMPPPVVMPVPLPPPVAVVPAPLPPPIAVAPAPSSTRKTLGIVGLFTGGAGLALGAAMGGVVIAKHGDLLKECPGNRCPTPALPDLASYHTYSAVSTAGFIAGGVLAGVGVVLLATAPRPRPVVGRWLTVTPALGVGYAGAEGSF